MSSKKKKRIRAAPVDLPALLRATAGNRFYSNVQRWFV
jgi:hypothetical protein